MTCAYQPPILKCKTLAEAGEAAPGEFCQLGGEAHLLGDLDQVRGRDPAVAARACNLEQIGLRQVEAVEARDSREAGPVIRRIGSLPRLVVELNPRPPAFAVSRILLQFPHPIEGRASICC